MKKKKICLAQEYESLFILSITLFINIIVLLVLFWGLWRSNIHEQNAAREKVLSISRHKIQGISELIKKIELIEYALRDEVLLQQKSGDQNNEKLREHIKRNFDRFPELVNFMYADPEGFIHSDAAGVQSKTPFAKKLKPFQFYIENKTSNVHFFEPIFGPIVKKWVVVFASRVTKPDGSFGGVIGASIKLSHLQSLLSKEDIGPNGVIEIRSQDLSVIAKHPDPISPIRFSTFKGKPLSASEKLISQKKQESVFLEKSPYDGRERLVSIEKVENFPLYIRVALSPDDYLSSWYDECRYAAGFYIVFLLITSFLSYKLNINRRKRYAAEDQLHRAARVFSDTHDGIMITDLNGQIIDVNAAFINITGYSREELIGQNPRILNSGQQGKAFYEAMWQTLIQTGTWSGQIWNRNKNGEIYADLLRINAVFDGKGKKQNYIGISSEITQIMKNEQELMRLAHYDALTGLLNRSLLDDRLHQSIANARRNSSSVAVAYVDLDGFKDVNDNFGHHVGDDLLVQVAKKMKAALREVDALIRLGGDEFLIIMGVDGSQENCELVLNRVLQAIVESKSEVNEEAKVSASIGVTIYPSVDAEVDLMLKHADEAMYQAKNMGKNRICFYKPK